MRRIMLRVEDDLHRRITDAAHDARLSTNRWLTGIAERAVTPVNSEPPKPIDPLFASGRPDFTRADQAILDEIDGDKPHNWRTGPWIVASAGPVTIEWVEPWDHSRAYLAGYCVQDQESQVFHDELPSLRPAADAWLEEHRYHYATRLPK